MLPGELSLRRLAPLLALALACGDTPSATSIAVELGADPTSCGSSAPADVILPCDSNVGVWLRDGGGALLDQACVAMAAQSSSLAPLAQVLADQVEFGNVQAAAVELVVAVFSPAAAGCPEPAMSGAVPTIYGDSGVVALTGQARIQVTLGCDFSGGTDPTCVASCDGDFTTCTQQVADQQAQCVNEQDMCLGGCNADPGCQQFCTDRFQNCIANLPDCAGDRAACVQGCAIGPGC